MNSQLTSWEQYILSDQRLRERRWELWAAMVVFALIGTSCAAGLVAYWSGVNLPESAHDTLWFGMIVGIGTAISVWREWRYVILLQKLKQQISELKARSDLAAEEVAPGQP
jgi:hypothetical protein